MSAYRGILLQNSMVIADGGLFVKFAVCPLSRSPVEGAAASAHRPPTLPQRLHRATSRDWRWGTAEDLNEPPQVLRGCGEQHFVPRAAQASQSKPVEPENALHMRKSHLNLLALADDCWKASVLASARTRTRTSSLTSRVTLRATAVVHFGFNEQIEQSSLLAL